MEVSVARGSPKPNCMAEWLLGLLLPAKQILGLSLERFEKGLTNKQEETQWYSIIFKLQTKKTL